MSSLLIGRAVVAFALISASSPADTQVTAERTRDLDLLVARKQYLELEQLLSARDQELSAEDRAYFDGVMANHLNRPQQSIDLLQPLIPGLLEGNPARGEVALCAVADDYVKKFRYGDAAQIYAEANRMAQLQKRQSSCSAAREAARWALLRDAPPQTISVDGEFSIQGAWDAVGLLQVPITLGAYSASWILDTGANLSVISKSVADRLGVQISNDSASSEGSSGRSIPVHTGVIPELRLGPAIIHNIAVLVAADADLRFSDLNYQIDGSLGLPVLAALGTITVYRTGEIRFAQVGDGAQARGAHNLFFEKLTPVIAADFGQGEQLFTIDTGAIGTVLSSQFYEQNRAEFDSAPLVQLELVGAGGSLVAPAYQLGEVAASLGGGCTTLTAVQLLTQPLALSDEFFGNVGEDALHFFASFSFDFETMHFSVNAGVPGHCPE
jgi:predicted aspartyl protease